VKLASHRIDDLEFQPIDSPGKRDHAIVQWFPREGEEGGEYCCVVCFFRRGSEGYDIEFVGDRPFRVENRDALWSLMRYGQRALDASFDLEEDLKGAAR
jgi:hypothetical protein